MKHCLFLLVTLLTNYAAYSTVEVHEVDSIETAAGFAVKKVWLTQFQMPIVSVKRLSTYTKQKHEQGIALLDSIGIVLGMDRKRPFALIRVPVVSRDNNGDAVFTSSFELHVEEGGVSVSTRIVAKKTTDVNRSVLADGTWYKIGVVQSGLHKIDVNFLKTMGVDASSINPANVRVYGSGGKMLPEANYISRPVDLPENAVFINDDGDGKFGVNDYVVFYGQGPVDWASDTSTGLFAHRKNLYTDTGYYFISFDKGASLRMETVDATNAGNVAVGEFDYHEVHEKDLLNPGRLGKIWYGEQFSQLGGSLSQTFSFDIGAAASSVNCKVNFGVSGSGNSSVSITMNGNEVGSASFNGTTDNVAMLLAANQKNIPINASSVGINIALTAASNVIGYLDYIQINARRVLTINSDQMGFRDLQSVGQGNVAQYSLQGASDKTIVFDITNFNQPVILKGTFNNGSYGFSREASVLHEFVALNTTNVPSPIFIGNVPNQNLHGLGQVDNIIVSHKNFLSQAKRLAEHHITRDGMSVIVVTPEEIYNEFSSGGQDISAIRDFVRMFYRRAGSDSTQMPKYLTILGGASYDYKNRVPANSNFVPVFESAESSYALNSFSTDDFYGFLDDSENIESYAFLNVLDIGIGRIPARTVEDAQAMVDKIIYYRSPETLGPWRISTTFVADNNDGAGDFLQDSEVTGQQLSNTTNSIFNRNKIYLDAIPIISTPAGERAPNATSSLNEQIFKGTMFINYVGHGNPQVWATERILTQDEFSKWKNKKMLPFMITATCDFGQFDQPQYVSAGEQLVLQKDGGVISILTTTAAVYASYNLPLNLNFIKTVFGKKENGNWHSFGEATRIGKNAAYSVSNNASELVNYRKFSLFGDPALVPNFPEHAIKIDSVIDVAMGATASQVKALGEYRLSGHVQDENGSFKSDFNGVLFVSFYDKPRKVTTITSANKTFLLQDNLIYKGKVNVVNGRFSYSFIVPKDINYYNGACKVSQYAHNGTTDASGSDTSILVGGYSDNPVLNDEPPVVRAYINDSLFQNGGITGANTSLYVLLSSKTGINVSGNSIGHDLIAILDDKVSTPYLLNDYYETELNTYKRGIVNFPLAGLKNGKHNIRVKAWDVNNNMGEGSVDFTVLDGKIVGIEQLANCPNPFSGVTHFVFEHNHPYEVLEVNVQIYNSNGALVKVIEKEMTSVSSRTHDIVWEGDDAKGASLPSGTYYCRFTVTADKVYKTSAYHKVVIIR